MYIITFVSRLIDVKHFMIIKQLIVEVKPGILKNTVHILNSENIYENDLINLQFCS